MEEHVQGLRALSVLLVILFHLEVAGFGGGFVGVDVFFVISGYVITRRLVTEGRARGGVSGWEFIARRVRRILPTGIVVVLLIVVWARLTYASAILPALRTEAVGASTGTINLLYAREGAQYARPVIGAFATVVKSPFVHYWSLAVEEQYYLGLAVVLLIVARFGGLRRWSRTKAAVVLAGLAIASVVTWQALSPYDFGSLSFFLLPARAWELAVGSLLALVPTTWAAKSPAWIAWLAVPAAWLTLAFTTRHFSDAELQHIAPHLLACLAALLFIWAGSSMPNRLLTSRPAAGIGNISYPLYLVHWPIILAFDQAWPGVGTWRRAIIVIAVAIAGAWLLHVVVEQPLRNARWWRHRVLGTNIAGLLVILSAVGVSVLVTTSGSRLGVPSAVAGPSDLPSDLTPSLQDAATVLRGQPRCTNAEHLTFALCVAGPRRASYVVAVLGDSHADQWFPALERLANERGWKAVLYGAGGCPWAEVPDKVLGTSCGGWRREVLGSLRTLRPDVIMLATYDAKYIELLGGRSPYFHDARLTKPKFPLGSRLVLMGDEPVVDQDTVVCLSTNPHHIERCAIPTQSNENVAARDAGRELARQVGAEWIDGPKLVCPGRTCPVVRGRLLVYRDGEHLTPQFTRSIASQLARFLEPH